MEYDELLQFVSDRNEALLSLDEEKIRDFSRKYNIPLSSNPLVFWASVHKCRLEVTSFSEEVKEESRIWLISHNFKPEFGPY